MKVKWRRRLPAILIGALFLAVAVASPALADPLGDAVKSAIAGQSNPMLSWIQLQDSHGVSVWQYELSIDRGNPLTAGDKWFWSKLVDQAWQGYRDGVVLAIWLLRWILDFGWLAPLTAAVAPIGAALHTTMGMLGLLGFFLTIAGVVGGIYIFRGRTATGVWELMVAVFVAAASATILANPTGLILSKPDGLVYRVHDTSLQFVSAMSQTPKLKDAGQTDAITSDLIVTFLRQPLELVNFGAVVDGTPCEAGYDEVLKSGPHAWGSEIRDKVAGCSAGAGAWAGAPSPAMFAGAGLLYPAVVIVFTLAIAIGGAVLMAGFNLAYLSVKATVTTIAGVLPGTARRPFLGTIADVVIALGIFIFSFVFLAIFLKAVQLILGGNDVMPAPQRILLTDVLLAGGLVIYLVNRKRIRASAGRLRELLSRRPGGSVASAPIPARLNTAAAISAATNVAHLGRSLLRRPGGSGLSAGQPMSGAAAVSGAGSGPQPRRSKGGGGGALTGRILTTASAHGLRHATGGASTVALTAFRVLRRPKRRPELVPPAPAAPAVAAGPIRHQLPPGRSHPRGPIALPPGPSVPPRPRPGPVNRGVQSRPEPFRSSPPPTRRQVPRRTGRRGGR